MTRFDPRLALIDAVITGQLARSRAAELMLVHAAISTDRAAQPQRGL